MIENLSNSLIYLHINCLKKEYTKSTKKTPKKWGSLFKFKK
jgi:hypothetical protein